MMEVFCMMAGVDRTVPLGGRAILRVERHEVLVVSCVRTHAFSRDAVAEVDRDHMVVRLFEDDHAVSLVLLDETDMTMVCEALPLAVRNVRW